TPRQAPRTAAGSTRGRRTPGCPPGRPARCRTEQAERQRVELRRRPEGTSTRASRSGEAAAVRSRVAADRVAEQRDVGRPAGTGRDGGVFQSFSTPTEKESKRQPARKEACFRS